MQRYRDMISNALRSLKPVLKQNTTHCLDLKNQQFLDKFKCLCLYATFATADITIHSIKYCLFSLHARKLI